MKEIYSLVPKTGIKCRVDSGPSILCLHLPMAQQAKDRTSAFNSEDHDISAVSGGRLTEYAVGEKLRMLRLKKGLGLSELGFRVGCSPSLLSKIERSKQFPTLTTLSRVAAVFGVRLGYFFDERRPIVTVIRAQARPLTKQGENYHNECFDARDFSFPPDLKLRIHIASFGHGDNKTQSHPGHKFLYQISGGLKLTIGSREYFLTSGDSIYFDSRVGHKYRGLGKRPSTALAITFD